MKIAFFETEEWEKPLLTKTFPDAILSDEKLCEDNADKYKEIEVVSCFVYSTLKKEALSKLPNLKMIATRSTGFDHIDTEYCKAHNIVVTNVPEYGSRTVAEFTFALMLAVSRNIYESVQQSKDCNFDHKIIRGFDLFGKKIGIIGLGKIGLEVLKIARGFGMQPLVNARTHDEKLAKEYGVTFLELPELLAQADIITLHLPDMPQTHHILNTENIMKIKPGSILINTARGGLIQTEAILMALEKGILAGVGLDVLEEENHLSEEIELLSSHSPHPADYKIMCMDHVLIRHPKVVVTPHNAFNSREALLRIVETTIDSIKHYTTGNPINVVS